MKVSIICFLIGIMFLTACNSKESQNSGVKGVVQKNEKQVKQTTSKVVGGGNVVKEDKVVEMGGIMAKLAPLADNLDVDKISKMSKEEQEKIIGNLEVLQGKQNMIVNSVNKAMAEFDIKVDEKTGKITVPDNILFGKNEDIISEEGKAYLDLFFKAYTESVLDESVIGYIDQIQVIGNTDPDGSYEYNQKLSERRAEAVLNYCLTGEKNGLTQQEREMMKKLMVVVGKSYDDLVYDKDGNIDKTSSRRVEIKVMMKTY